ncbi:MAG: hydroxymethylbilane synthase [Pseudomonadota bacterium]
MNASKLTIATRESDLALWQAEHVKSQLIALYEDLKVELLPIKTQGDRILDQPLAKIGGKGLFIKELQHALLEHRADIAVHSMKDVPIEDTQELAIAVILRRADPRDVFVSRDYDNIATLPSGATVGTSSLRRKSQLMLLRDDLRVIDLRGNVPTRIKRMEEGKYDAIILAAAGVKRLGLENKIRASLSVEQMLPAVGQGAIGIECRSSDEKTRALIEPLADSDTTTCVLAERAMSRQLQGSCEVPMAAHAVLKNSVLSLAGLVASIDGRQLVTEALSGTAENPQELGKTLALRLQAEGADELIRQALLHANGAHS